MMCLCVCSMLLAAASFVTAKQSICAAADVLCMRGAKARPRRLAYECLHRMNDSRTLVEVAQDMVSGGESLLAPRRRNLRQPVGRVSLDI